MADDGISVGLDDATTDCLDETENTKVHVEHSEKAETELLVDEERKGEKHKSVDFQTDCETMQTEPPEIQNGSRTPIEEVIDGTGEEEEEEEDEMEAEQDKERENTESVDKIKKRVQKSKLYVFMETHQWPIVYSPDYNISFLGFEKLHPFDSGKWGKVYNYLKGEGMVRDETTVRPLEASDDDLLVAHTKQYINSLKWSISVAGITEVPPVALLPNFIVQRKVLRPLRLQTGGSILAAKLALERGWAINIGGGFHHCSSKRGGGFCAYADITLALRFLFALGHIEKAMILDLDAHQGNGHERDFMQERDSVYILDVYNRHIYPRDGFAKRGISRKVEVNYFIADEQYLTLVASNLESALNEFVPDIMIYNAGTDSLEGDPLGALSISPQGIIKRDMMVFEFALDRRKPIPILMVTSGGYQRNNADIIAASILNLWRRKLITCPEAEEFQAKLGTTPTATMPSSSSNQPSTSQSSEMAPSRGNANGTSQSRGFFSSLRAFCK